MSRERLTVTAIIDTGSADVFGLEGLEPRVVARAFRLLLQEMALPGTTVDGSMAVITADGPDALESQAGALARAEQSMAENLAVLNAGLRCPGGGWPGDHSHCRGHQ